MNNDGFIDCGEMKNFFQDEQYGESGASTTPEAQIWEQIMDELDKDGTKRVNYKNFHSSMVSVIQRGAVDPDTLQRDQGLRKSLI